MDNSSIENNDETLEFPLRFTIEAAFHTLPSSNEKLPLYFYNYLILDQDSIPKDFNVRILDSIVFKYSDTEQRKNILNDILKDFSQRVSTPIVPSQKTLGQIIIDPKTLITCCSLTFRPIKTEYWEQLWSLKFQSNINLAIETEFYFTKGFFRVAFHDTFHKIEIPGQIYHGIPTNLIILLPRCSSDLVHLYANIKEYLNLPYTSAFVGVCLPKISMDTEMNLIEPLKSFETFSEQIDLGGAHFLGHFSLDMSTSKSDQSSSSPCLHSIDLSPVTPWIFFANRPFLFLLTYGDTYILIGQMLGPKIRQTTKEYLSKYKTKHS